MNTILYQESHYPRHYSTWASVRFDTVLEQNIVFHNDIGSLNSSVLASLPDPTLSFPNPESGSDVLSVLQRYLHNTEGPLCGSKVFVIAGRDLNGTYDYSLIDSLQKNFVAVHTIQGFLSWDGPTNGPIAMVSTYSNGFYDFADSIGFDEATNYLMSPVYSQNLLYATYCRVGSGSQKLPNVRIPSSKKEYVALTLLIVIPDGSDMVSQFQPLNITMSDVNRPGLIVTFDILPDLFIHDRIQISGANFSPDTEQTVSINGQLDNIKEGQATTIQVEILMYTYEPVQEFPPFIPFQ